MAMSSRGVLADKPMKTDELAMPVARPPKKMTRLDAKPVWPRQRRMRRTKHVMANKLDRTVGNL